MTKLYIARDIDDNDNIFISCSESNLLNALSESAFGNFKYDIYEVNLDSENVIDFFNLDLYPLIQTVEVTG